MTTLHQIDRQLDTHLEAEVQRLDALFEAISTEDLETLCAAIDAQAVGVNRTFVSQRLKYNTLPQQLKNYVGQEILSETHLMEIVGLFIDEYFSPWLAPQLSSFSDAAHTARQRRVIAELRQSGDAAVIDEMERLIKG